VGDLSATKSEDFGLIVRGISFQPMWPWSTNVTDGQTDGQTDDMQSQDRTLHGKKRHQRRSPTVLAVDCDVEKARAMFAIS